MNGEWLGNRQIRVNWANQKGINAGQNDNMNNQNGKNIIYIMKKAIEKSLY